MQLCIFVALVRLYLLSVDGALALLMHSCPRLHREIRKALVSAHTPIGKQYVFKRVADQELSIFVDSPAASSKEKARPAMLFFHGGGWVGGPLNQFDRQAEYLSGRGLVAIQVQYRLGKKGDADPIDPAVQDAKSAMRWVRSHAPELGIDPHRIAAAGGSAGGQLAAFLGMMDGKDDPKDDLSVSSKADLMLLFNPAIDLGPGSCCRNRAGEDYEALSPRYHVRPGLPASLIMQGDSDVTVSPAMISAFANTMKQAGNDCTLVLYSKVGHGFFNANEGFYKTLENVDSFLVSHGWLQGQPDREAIRKLPAKDS